MRVSILSVVGLCFIGSTNASTAAVYGPAPHVACAGLASPAICSPKSTPPNLIKVADATQLTDGEIAYIYLQGNEFDVEEAELGVARGTASDVKEHGEMVAKDHRGVVETFEGILTKNGIKPIAPPDDAATLERHHAVMADLKARSGANFDREYLTQAIIGHRAFIALVNERLLPAARNPEIASHLKGVLPAFEKHLAMTIAAAKRLADEK
jgi:putative membrane protein